MSAQPQLMENNVCEGSALVGFDPSSTSACFVGAVTQEALSAGKCLFICVRNEIGRSLQHPHLPRVCQWGTAQAVLQWEQNRNIGAGELSTGRPALPSVQVGAWSAASCWILTQQKLEGRAGFAAPCRM